MSNLDQDFEIVFVNDGSPDKSASIVQELIANDSRVRMVDLSRNFGHHPAILAGLEEAQGSDIFLIDSDLEEDPCVIEELWSLYVNCSMDADVVYGIQKSRKGDWFERISGEVYYWFFSFLSDITYPKNTLTSRIMSRRYVDAVISYPEREVDVWCLFSLVGFKQVPVELEKKSSSKTTYTFKRKLEIALNTITSVSSKPLYLIFLLGFSITCFSLSYICYVVLKKVLFADVVEGWTSLISSIWLIGGLIIFSIGVIGIYLSKIFNEIKKRPRSIVKDYYGKKQY